MDITEGGDLNSSCPELEKTGDSGNIRGMDDASGPQ
jgi:hypothetical protein